MAKLDFNKINRPVLELTMEDEAQTNITVETPSEGLVEELEAMIPELDTIFSPDNPKSVDAAYDLAARLMSCNQEGVTVTADDLRTKYWRKNTIHNQLALMSFIGAYMDFLQEIKNAKN